MILRIIPFNDLIKKLVTEVTNNDSRIIISNDNDSRSYPFNDLINKLVTGVTNNDSRIIQLYSVPTELKQLYSVPTELKIEPITIIPGRIHVDVAVNVTIMVGNYK